MKTLYINIDSTATSSNEHVEVMNYSPCDDFYFHVGEKIAGRYADEIDLIPLLADYEAESGSIPFTEQWEKLKSILLGKEPQGVYALTLPKEYLTWLRFSANTVYRNIYNDYYKDMQSASIDIDIKELYDDSVALMIGEVCRYLDRNADKGFTHLGFDESVGLDSLLCQQITNSSNLCYSSFNTSNIKEAGSFYNGRALLRRGNKIGFINQRGEIIAEKEYDGPYGIVDLGLGVCWAECNVGASLPEASGGYYAWGEILEKDDYDWNTYKHCDGSRESINKYCTDIRSEKFDNTKKLEFVDDVAHVKLDGSWRMPTIGEIEELINECTWEWTTINGVKGYQILGPNGNSIFLPAAGHRYKRYGVELCGCRGFLWTCELDDHDNYALGLCFDSGCPHLTDFARVDGFPIRPVFEL